MKQVNLTIASFFYGNIRLKVGDSYSGQKPATNIYQSLESCSSCSSVWNWKGVSKPLLFFVVENLKMILLR